MRDNNHSDLRVEVITNEAIIYDYRSGESSCLSPMATIVWILASQGKTYSGISKLLSEEFEGIGKVRIGMNDLVAIIMMELEKGELLDYSFEDFPSGQVSSLPRPMRSAMITSLYPIIRKSKFEAGSPSDPEFRNSEDPSEGNGDNLVRIESLSGFQLERLLAFLPEDTLSGESILILLYSNCPRSANWIAQLNILFQAGNVKSVVGLCFERCEENSGVFEIITPAFPTYRVTSDDSNTFTNGSTQMFELSKRKLRNHWQEEFPIGLSKAVECILSNAKWRQQAFKKYEEKERSEAASQKNVAKSCADERYLLYQIHEAGFANQLISLEVAAGISHLTGRKLVVYGNFDNEKRIWHCRGGKSHRIRSDRRWMINNARRPNVLQLMQHDNLGLMPYSRFRDILMASPKEIEHSRISLASSYFATVGDSVRGQGVKDCIKQFADGRTLFADSDSEVLHLNRVNLAFYSRFFYEPTRELLDILESIVLKRQYREIAENIAEILGEFVGVHIRLTDFRKYRPQNPEKYPKEIIGNLLAVFERDAMLVISTDESDNKNFFKPILDTFPRTVFLDEFIVRSFHREFKQLQYTDETTLAVICMWVLSYGRDFLGTPGSSFTGVIQRLLLRNVVAKSVGPLSPEACANCFKFVNSGFPPGTVRFESGQYVETQEGPYSWNRIDLPVPCKAMSWFREWPESVNLEK